MSSLNLVTTTQGKLDTGDTLVLSCPVNYYYITTQEQADEAISRILPFAQDSNRMLAIDLETNGFDPYLNDIVTLQIGTPDDFQYIFDARKVDCSCLVPVFKQPCWKLGHNIKFDAKFLAVKFDVRLENFFDTYLAEKVIRGGSFTRGVGYALDAVMLDRLGKELKIESNRP